MKPANSEGMETKQAGYRVSIDIGKMDRGLGWFGHISRLAQEKAAKACEIATPQAVVSGKIRLSRR